MHSFEQQQKNNAPNQPMTIQPKLEVGNKDDEHEKEANDVAGKVMKMGEGETIRRMGDEDEDKVMKMGEEEDEGKVMKMHDEDEGKVMKMGEEEEEGKVMKMHDEDEGKVMKMGEEEEEGKVMKMGEEEEEGKVMKMGEGNGGGMTAPANVESGIAQSKGSGQNLPGNVQKDLGGKMGADFSGVKVHTDSNAHEMNESISAKAFTHGQDIYFKQGNYSPETSKGKELLAHELVHTQQQGGESVRMKPELGDKGRILRQGAALRSSALKNPQDPYGNIIADLSAGDAVTIHEKTKGFLKVTVTHKKKILTGYVSSELVVNFSEDERTSSENSSKENVVSGSQYELSNPNMKNAVFYCTIKDTMYTVALNEVADVGSSSNKITVDTAKLKAKFTKKGIQPSSIYVSYPGENGYEIVYSLYLNEHKLPAAIGPMIDPNILLNKVQQSHKNASMTPGPWMPPGNQPPPFYIGNEAHKAIAKYYGDMHPGQLVYKNYTPIGTILAAYQLQGFKVDWAKLNAIEMLAKPDILNKTISQLYEIKPWSSAPLAAAEASFYVSIFAKAGIPMTLGNSMDLGVVGVVPAPGGFYVFSSPMPGVVIYRYQKTLPDSPPIGVPSPVWRPVTSPRRIPITNPNPYTLPVVDPSPGIGDMKYWEEVTGLTGGALILYLIISEGSRLFPPRNLIPIP